MIRFSCPSCGKKLKAADHAAGRNVSCPRCGERLSVPPLVEDKLELVEEYGSGPQAAPPVAPPLAESCDGPSPAATAAPASPPSKLDRMLALLGQQRASRKTTGPPPDDVKEPSALPVPRFTKDGALVKCPRCGQLEHIREDDYNKQIKCSKCNKGIVAVVALSRGWIPLLCPQCGYGLEAPPNAGGKTHHCDNCSAVVPVPEDHVMMLKADQPIRIPWKEVMGGARVGGKVLMFALDFYCRLQGQSKKGGSQGPRTCAKCGRFIRNPFGYCYQCQKGRDK